MQNFRWATGSCNKGPYLPPLGPFRMDPRPPRFGDFGDRNWEGGGGGGGSYKKDNRDRKEKDDRATLKELEEIGLRKERERKNEEKISSKRKQGKSGGPYPGSPEGSSGNRNDKDKDKRKDAKSPSVEDADVSIEQIKKDYTVVQHPATLIPLGICAVAVLISIAGGGLPALAFAGGAGVVGFGSAAWRLIKRGNYLDEKTQQLLVSQAERRKREAERKLVELRQTIFQGFSDIGSKEGLKELSELIQEYGELIGVLARLPEGADVVKLVSAERISQLARDTYHQGLLALHRAWETMREVESANRHNLELEVTNFETEIARLEKSPLQTEMLAIKRQRLELTRQRLDKINQQAIMIEKLLQQSDKCEGELHQTRLDVIALSNEGSGEKADEVMQRLQNVIQTAIAVQEELNKVNRSLGA